MTWQEKFRGLGERIYHESTHGSVNPSEFRGVLEYVKGLERTINLLLKRNEAQKEAIERIALACKEGEVDLVTRNAIAVAKAGGSHGDQD